MLRQSQANIIAEYSLCYSMNNYIDRHLFNNLFQKEEMALKLLNGEYVSGI